MARQECSHMGAFCVQHTPDRINGRICEIEVFSFFPSIVPLDNSIA